jgi:hypothetical protein
MFPWLARAVWKEPIMRRAAVAVLAALLAVITAAGPAGAVGAFGPPAKVIDPHCGSVSSHAVVGGSTPPARTPLIRLMDL